MWGAMCSLKDSGVKGLEIKNFAPAPMSGVASVVMNPKLTFTPLLLRASSNSRPVMFGMFQSESTRSGTDALMAARAFAPSSASVNSCPSNPAYQNSESFRSIVKG